MTTKLEEAMRLVDQGIRPHAASKLAGLKQASSVYAEIKRRRDAASLVTCPCCGSQVQPDQIDHAWAT